MLNVLKPAADGKQLRCFPSVSERVHTWEADELISRPEPSDHLEASTRRSANYALHQGYTPPVDRMTRRRPNQEQCDGQPDFGGWRKQAETRRELHAASKRESRRT